MAKKVPHLVAAGLLWALASCATPPDDAAQHAWEREGCTGQPERPCPESYCTCWDRIESCRCSTRCPCARRHGR